MTPFVLEQGRESSFEELPEALLGAFRSLVGALGEGRPAVVVLRDVDIAGRGDPAAAAYAHALLGLVRALAIEGARDGWVINAVSIADDAPAHAWVERLGQPEGLSGALLRLGDGHLGRIPA